MRSRGHSVSCQDRNTVKMSNSSCLRILFFVTLVLLIPFFLIRTTCLVVGNRFDVMLGLQHLLTLATDTLFIVKCGRAAYYMSEDRFMSSKKYAFIAFLVSVVSLIMSCGFAARTIFLLTLEGINVMILSVSVCSFFFSLMNVQQQKGDSNSIY